MSLNNISLNPQLLAGLYPDSLLETGKSITVPDPKELTFLGGNKRQILILVNHPDVPYLPDGELTFLTNILSACKLGIADVAIVNLQKTDKGQLSDLPSRDIILFGLTPPDIDLPINFPPFRLQQFNSRTYLYALTLTEVERDKALKMQLWNSLKNLFNV